MIQKIFLVPDRRLIDAGLLIMRIGIGIMFMLHGWSKLTGGPEKWTDLGAEMSTIGITFGYTFWGFMAMFSEFFGGLLFALGLFTRATAFLMLFTMIIATLHHFAEYNAELAEQLDPAKAEFSFRKLLLSGSHSLELGLIFLAYMFTGPGSYSLDSKFFCAPDA